MTELPEDGRLPNYIIVIANFVKTFPLPKTVFRVSAIPIKIQKQFLTEIESMLKFHMKAQKDPRLPK